MVSRVVDIRPTTISSSMPFVSLLRPPTVSPQDTRRETLLQSAVPKYVNRPAIPVFAKSDQENLALFGWAWALCFVDFTCWVILTEMVKMVSWLLPLPSCSLMFIAGKLDGDEEALRSAYFSSTLGS